MKNINISHLFMLMMITTSTNIMSMNQLRKSANSAINSASSAAHNTVQDATSKIEKNVVNPIEHNAIEPIEKNWSISYRT